VVTDIANFWRAYDAGGRDGSASAFQTEYLDRATPGLRDFVALRSISATSLAQMVRAFPRYFADIRPRVAALSEESPAAQRIRQGYARVKALYPAATFPSVTFAVGRFSTAGTTSANGMLIGVEFYGLGPGTPLDELGPFQRNNARPLDSLPVIVAHEHAHILQMNARALFAKSGKNLLEQALLEGSADFVGELVSGGNINSSLRAFAIPREAALWTEFSAEMRGVNVSRWLYNQGQATPDRPGDLGYFIGYRIVEAFYRKAADKAAALRDIIEVRDAEAFLASSGYSGTPTQSRWSQ
jgi:hypothetical protein